MRAVILPEFRDTDLLEERDVERLRPGSSEVLVHAFASAVIPADTKL
jgi:NADPH:quinone reductase-like Zn-dependent oxidoreductase